MNASAVKSPRQSKSFAATAAPTVLLAARLFVDMLSTAKRFQEQHP